MKDVTWILKSLKAVSVANYWNSAGSMYCFVVIGVGYTLP